jgi:hypothetical protein
VLDDVVIRSKVSEAVEAPAAFSFNDELPVLFNREEIRLFEARCTYLSGLNDHSRNLAGQSKSDPRPSSISVDEINAPLLL